MLMRTYMQLVRNRFNNVPFMSLLVITLWMLISPVVYKIILFDFTLVLIRDSMVIKSS